MTPATPTMHQRSATRLRTFGSAGGALWMVLAAALAAPAQDAASQPVAYSRDIRPILAKHCFACHGPDDETREADLRLDQRPTGDALQHVLAPGRPDQSELLARVSHGDSEQRMPPDGEPLESSEVEQIRTWIAHGAAYDRHWAFVPPRRPQAPRTQFHGWTSGPLDAFVAARLQERGLQPAAAADRHALIRRVSLDLTGLPPSPREVDDFVNDNDPLAYQRLVDRKLASPHYGERWARKWLDLARYADTNGYEKDRPRSIWPYRDWVIRSLNADKPYDAFSVEQLAGDMLPQATIEQRVATGFHRNTMLNEEGGIDPLEYRYYAMVDRVATTGLVWLGLTTGCAQCHSHKYDPISHRDYFALMALLDNAAEVDLQLSDAEADAQHQAWRSRVRKLELDVAGARADDFESWVRQVRDSTSSWVIARPVATTSNLPKLDVLDDGSIFSRGDITKRDVFALELDLDQIAETARASGASLDSVAAIRLEALPDDRLPAGGPGRAYYEGRQGDFFLSELSVRREGQPIACEEASHSFGKISIGSGTAEAANVLDNDGSTGWSTASREGQPHQLVIRLKDPAPAHGKITIGLLFERHFAASLGRFRLSVSDASDAVAKDLSAECERRLRGWSPEATPIAELDQSLLVELRRSFLRNAPGLEQERKRLARLLAQEPKPTRTLVMQERRNDNPRTTHRRHRGEYLKIREIVAPGIPEVFGELPGDAAPNRLALARWLVSERNPLAARTAVNRAWRAFFGRGLLASDGDFGSQSPAPSHPELLDWLACEFRDGGWSTKRLHRRIVTSAVYRQASKAPESFAADPENEWLARGPSHRLDAELIRDAMLLASGALSNRIGGPSVYPPQPASVTALAYGSFRWNVRDPFRRSLYTFSKRTAPFAAYTVFDGPTGEQCVVKRDNSNTPLQALTLLNDAMYVQLARYAALDVLRQPTSTSDRLGLLFRRFVTRPPTVGERQVLQEFLSMQRARLGKNAASVQAILGADQELAESTGVSRDQWASWTLTARVIMNLHASIAR